MGMIVVCISGTAAICMLLYPSNYSVVALKPLPNDHQNLMCLVLQFTLENIGSLKCLVIINDVSDTVTSMCNDTAMCNDV